MSTEHEILTSEASKDISSSDLLSQPWDKLLEDSPREKPIPTIIRTRPSFEVPRTENGLNLTDPNSLSPNVPPPPGVGRLTRTQSLGARRSSGGSSILGNFHKQLRFSLRGDRSSGKDGPGGPLARYRQARYASRRVRKRVVFKHGDCNVVQGNVSKRRKRYLQDLFTTLVDAQWRWTLLVFAMSFLLSWLGFALVWWLIAYAHGDLDRNESLTPCVINVDSFTSSFLFSVETQHTIGYGGRMTTQECPEAIFIMCLQSIVGVFIQAFMVGIVFAKLSRPKNRAQTLLFSHSAAICQRDGQFVFMFRVGDMRKSHIVEAHVRAQMIRKKVTREGELLPFYQQELKVGADGEEDRLMFIWPTTIVHKITETSPLYGLSASDMLRERFEIVVMLEGVIESTGMTTQARSSFLPSEIYWGHRFEPIVSFKKETGEYEVDYTLFNNTYEVDTPLCSAKQLDELRASVSVPNRLDRLVVSSATPVHLGPSASHDTLDSCSVDSMSLDEHIEIKIPESRIEENRKMLESQNPVPLQRQNGNIIHEESPNGEHVGIIVNGNIHEQNNHNKENHVHNNHNSENNHKNDNFLHVNESLNNHHFENHRHQNGGHRVLHRHGSDQHLLGNGNGIIHNGTNNHVRMYRTPSGHLSPQIRPETSPLKISMDYQREENQTPPDFV